MKEGIHEETGFKVFSNGVIIGSQGKPLKYRINKDGYYDCSISANGIRRTMLVHRIVAQTFLENPIKYKQVNHIDGDKKNNDISNLEWCSGHHNIRHAYMNQLIPTKIKPWEVEYIYTNPDKLTNKELSEKFNVSINTIYGITCDNKWTHITKDLNNGKLMTQPRGRLMSAISPNGDSFKFNNLSKFCREKNLTLSAVNNRLTGKISKPYKGWVFNYC